MRRQRRGGRRLRLSILMTLACAGALLAVPGSALAAYAPWVAQTSGTTRSLFGVAFTDATDGWAVGDGGTIRHTTNGGTTWTAQTSGTTQPLNAVTFVNATTGWAVGGGGVILHTTNAGAKWVAQTSRTTQALNGVAFADAGNGWAAGGRGTILRTTNGGATWTAQASGSRQTLNALACSDAATCWAIGNKGAVLRTVNAGATWTSQSAGTRTTLYAVGCSGASTAWIGGSGGTVRTTANGGGAWTPQTSGTGQTLRALAAQDASHLRLVGSGGTIRATANGGTTWTPEATGTTQTLYGVAWRGTRGWVVGAGGTALAYRPDLAAPTTSAVGLQADDQSGWRNTPETVTLAATDTGRAGVAARYYTVDGGGRTTYTAPFAVSGQGRHIVTYWSVDAAGNIEDARIGYVNIDTTPPTVAHDVDSGWQATDVSVHLTATDEGGSGVAVVHYRATGSALWLDANGGGFTVAAAEGDGARTYEIRSVDAAGNASLTGVCTVRIDATAPTTTSAGLGADTLSGWTTTPRIVSLTADDGAGSGVQSIYYTVDGDAPLPYTKPFGVSGAGQHPVTYWSVDELGHVEPVHTGWVNIADVYAQSQGLAPDQSSGWYKGTADVTIATGGGTGPLSVCYTLDGGAVQTVAGSVTFPVSGAGHHSVVFWALDGSTESTRQTGYVNIDVVRPVTTMTATPSTAPRRWVNRPVDLAFPASDDASGLASTFSSVNGQVPVPGASLTLPAPLTHLGDGVFAVRYWSVDNAGNMETAKSVTVRIDTRRPTVSARYAASAYRGGIAKLRFVVRDKVPCAGKAAARIVVKNAHNRVVKTIRKTVKTGIGSTVSFRCGLARGKYRFYVYATDLAGNKQAKVAWNRLTVR